MKPRLSLSSPLRFTRSYATRLPERPPSRNPDPLLNNPHAVYKDLPENVTFIHRPPPTAPSPLSYTTLPASPLLQSSATPVDGPLPPSLWKDKGEKPRVSDEDIARIRQLRREDPQTWTRGRLAAEFNCTQWFVGKITSLKSADRKKVVAEVEKAHAANRDKWGERRKLNADIRKKRKEFW
ncbi:hypothetical protein L226DRAFT_544090 [Lentinus tigrinus ALCF2SS1-7]|uniref:mitochondrial 54S ribosomal protein mL58 n=1 Tax=Lentinus tigrinus ALCF2SS1-7 TaxID=1328758 RepID=UPI001166005C|nr:hypothetical protein L226DRAFT_544090 [Lentinus tigrinus ALCF2SS1-7]